MKLMMRIQRGSSAGYVTIHYGGDPSQVLVSLVAVQRSKDRLKRVRPRRRWLSCLREQLLRVPNKSQEREKRPDHQEYEEEVLLICGRTEGQSHGGGKNTTSN